MLWEWSNDHSFVYILDLDGTLMPSAEIDNQCFWRAVFACFGEKEKLPDLHGFKHITDSGILNEWCILELGRPPLADETRKIKKLFVQFLKSAANRDPGHFQLFPGVSVWLKAVSEQTNVHAGIATGGWEHSARLKMKLSGLDQFDLPLASSDDAMARTDIMQLAAQKIFKKQADPATKMTYVGDGTWDLEASRQLGWDFIGISTGIKAQQLLQAGAPFVQADYRKKLA